MKVIDIIEKRTKFLKQKKRALQTLKGTIANVEQEIKILTDLNRRAKNIKPLKNGEAVKIDKIDT